MSSRVVAVGPETLTVRLVLNLARDYDRAADHGTAARFRLLAAIVQNCPNVANLEHAGRAIRYGRAQLTSCPPPSSSPKWDGGGQTR